MFPQTLLEVSTVSFSPKIKAKKNKKRKGQKEKQKGGRRKEDSEAQRPDPGHTAQTPWMAGSFSTASMSTWPEKRCLHTRPTVLPATTELDHGHEQRSLASYGHSRALGQQFLVGLDTRDPRTSTHLVIQSPTPSPGPCPSSPAHVSKYAE